jgi:hypothetical protein
MGLGGFAAAASVAVHLFVGFGTAISTVRSWFGRGDPFQVATHGQMIFVYPGKLVYTYDSALGRTLAPVGVALDVDVNNLSEKPIKIFHYAVEAQIDGKWRPLPTLAVLNPRSVYWVSSKDLSDCIAFDFTDNGFDIEIHEKTVAPGESLRGWIFLEWPTDLRRPDTPPTISKFRIELGDAWGSRQRTELPVDWKQTGKDLASNDWAMGGELVIRAGTRHEDLRGLVVMPATDLHSLATPPK